MPQFWLEFEQEENSQKFDFSKQTVTIGRDSSSDFHVDHPTVSRQHAMIVEVQGAYQLVVLSKNGLTAIDGDKVEGTIDLLSGMVLQMGEIKFTFLSNDVPAKEPPKPADDPFSEAPTQAISIEQAEQIVVGEAPKEEAFTEAPTQAVSIEDAEELIASGPAADSSAKEEEPAELKAPKLTSISDFDKAAEKKEKEDKDADADPDRIKSWEEIAEMGKTSDHEAVKGPTDFERIKEAAKKAEAGSQNNPVIIIGGILGIAALMAFLFWPADGPVVPGCADDSECGEGLVCDNVHFVCIPENACQRKICPPPAWKEHDCVGTADCQAKAEAAYKISGKLVEEKGADITNLYEAYRQLDKAEILLAKGKISKPPESMKDLDKKLKGLEAQLDDRAREYRVRYHQLKQRRMYKDMAEAVLAWMAYFPDKYSAWHEEPLLLKREMKDEGVWPRHMK